ncbi:uncharacterized protein UV8b_01272 [Ustilaginoidea virens]|uniref:Major facilitator superfamily (MFS) profile domain-containing protein n=1 Tax=Ustilaginoidea virens TaxID=1159556 RepID=A0A8E5MF32_USTVR|nr:uncharacterized protein UV8b_01272 [Ustilaginoidea virens]QUC17031.1 hypothetical protein UV8b_01272 [Ustilaginoidea virens]
MACHDLPQTNHRSPEKREPGPADARKLRAPQAVNHGHGLVPETAETSSSTCSHDDQALISWGPDDPQNPHNWSTPRKAFVVVIIVLMVFNSSMSSALPSMAIPSITAELGASSAAAGVLPISMFLVGYIFGPLIWAPLTEHYGRRCLTVLTFAAFSLFTMACAVAPSWPSFLAFRVLTGLFAGAPIATSAGIMADLFPDHTTRGRVLAIYMSSILWGPLIAPVISGFSAISIGWRWTFWIGFIFAAASFCLVAWLPETFAPTLLARRAQRLRRPAPPSCRLLAPGELQERTLAQLLANVITRPVRMLASELIVIATSLYVALVYAVFYMSFQAFPIIFRGLYGLSPAETGLTYLLIGAGGTLSLPVAWSWDMALAKAQKRGSWWSGREEFRRLPLACMGGPLFVVSLLWLGFGAKTSVSFVVPMLAGVPFGLGFMLIFTSMLNYLTDAYETFAASANAAASCCRSILAMVLPLATTPMFRQLRVAGACALIAGLSALMCVIPFLFIWKGPGIRERSSFCIALKEQKEKTQQTRQDARRASAESARARGPGKGTDVVIIEVV